MSGPRSVEKSGRSVEEALEAALDELGVNRDEVEVEVLDEPNRGLLGWIGGKLARIRVTVKEGASPPGDAEREARGGGAAGTPASAGGPAASGASEALQLAAQAKLSRARDFLREVARLMGAPGQVETRRVEGDLFHLNVVTPEPGLLIGRRGQTLDAIQYLVNMAANRRVEGPWVRFVVDAGEYRRRREAALRALAVRTARRVRQGRTSVALEPMNALERRVIHLALKDDPSVMTRSEGEEPNRRVVILPREEGPGENNRQPPARRFA